MPRVRSQLAIQAPPELLERLRAAAAARGQTVTRLLLSWIEAGLAGDLPAPGAGGGAELLERVAALEATTAELRVAVAQLQASPRRPPRPVGPSISRTGEGRPGSPSPERVSPATPAGDQPAPPAAALTTAELAERTGTNRSAWNNWAGPSRIGEVRLHPTAGPWRLVGKGTSEAGGPMRWLWAPADS
jgi:hypothetical protein